VRVVACAGWAAIVALAAGAAAADAPDVHDAAPGHPGVTYLDLLRQAIPDLADNAADNQTEGHLAKLHHLLGKADEGSPPDPVVVSYLEDLRITAGGHRRIVLLAPLGDDPDRAQDTALLALYDDAPKPKLLDAVDVGVDRDTSFNDPAKLPLGPGDDALVTYSEHGNSEQGYATRVLIFFRDDRLQLIDSVFTLSDHGCGWDRDETPAFSTRADPGRAYRRVEVVVSETLKHQSAACGDESIPKAYARTYHGSWRWDAGSARFKAQTRELERLDKLNQARF
jgi:hypothetical protein